MQNRILSIRSGLRSASANGFAGVLYSLGLTMPRVLDDR